MESLCDESMEAPLPLPPGPRLIDHGACMRSSVSIVEEQPIKVTWYDGTTEYYYSRKYWEDKHGITRHTLGEAIEVAKAQDPPPVHIDPIQDAKDIEAHILQHQSPQWLQVLIATQQKRDELMMNTDNLEQAFEEYDQWVQDTKNLDKDYEEYNQYVQDLYAGLRGGANTHELF